ncbi:MAG: polyhydroxyalkanoate synthesis regulator DNA-binding domain-containing protein [Deltaproteobacteria bacterium]|nr:polyhydroxyalkanoate synthesis regulator DNA-binding domain-containing protein [Deltaproteobacteria bacterium]
MSDKADKKEPRVIKRYANRKLYDMSQSCYITHEEIAALVQGGEDVRIVDNKTKADLTSTTLTQILLDEERRVRRSLPIDTLKEFFARRVRQPVVNLREEAEKRVREMLQGIRREPDKTEPAPAPAPPPEPAPAPTASGKPTEVIRHAVEERWADIQSYFSQFDFPRRIAELERRIVQLEHELAEARGQKPPNEADPS